MSSAAVSELIEQHAGEIASASVRRLSASQQTLAASVLAVRFVKQCAQLAARDEWPTLSYWVDDACDRYADVMPAARVLASTADGLARLLASSASSLAAKPFLAVRPAVDAALARPRVTRLTRSREAIDEIDVVIDGLLTQLDQSDVLTAEHSRAVSSWCTRLGVRLGMSKHEIIHLGRAGLIHDIGKVGTPSEILGAPRRLSDEEMVIMRAHAAGGATIVAAVPLIANLVPAVRNHHERIDGNGYPDGLRGEGIPRIARIVAVADAFNAMIGRRPYRPPLAPSIALERLIEGRGSQFDPEMVDAMVDVVQPNLR